MIASDLHGSEFYAKKLLERFEIEKPDKLVLLGDIYNHGPRNPLPEGYNPMGVAAILNSIKDKLIVVKGNCDSEVDQMISQFTFVEEAQLYVDGKVITCTHGHKINKENMPINVGDVLAYGHYHVNFMERVNNVLVVNPGSISLPKNNTISGYILIFNGNVLQYNMKGDLLQEEQI